MENKKGFMTQFSEWGIVSTITQSIRNKLITALLSLALIPLVILSFIAYIRSSDALMENAFENLKTLESSRANAIQVFFEKNQSDMRNLNHTVKTLRAKAFKQLATAQQLKKKLIESYFNERINDVRMLSAAPGVIEALKAFSQVKDAIQGPRWKEIENIYGPVINRVAESHGYYDVYLVSDDGKILYTAAQESDMGQNLNTAPLKQSPAAKAFEQGLKDIAFQDFEAYEPAYGDIAAFISAPVKTGNQTIGVIMLQVSVDQINFIMQERTGLGQSGESYLVGADGLFRSDSVHIEESTIMNPAFVVDTKGTAEALAGRSGQGVAINFRGEYVLSSWTPVRVYNQTWAMLGEIEVTEAFIPRDEIRNRDFFTAYKEECNYDNICLINPDGFMFFTIEKTDDYRTNMLTGPYKDTNLGRLIAKVLETKEPGMADFEIYPPLGEHAAFVAMPVLSEDGNAEAIVAAQLSIAQISAVMQDRTGLGKTGETYLVGSDKMFRSESVFLKQMNVNSTIMNPQIKADTDAAKEALEGKKGTRVIKDYRGIQVLSSWSSITVSPPSKVNPGGIRWAVIAQMDYEEVNRPVANMMMSGSTLILIVTCVVVGLALWLSHSLTVQVNHISELIEQIGMGNFEARTPVSTRDELGTMAISLNAMLDNLLSLIRNR